MEADDAFGMWAMSMFACGAGAGMVCAAISSGLLSVIICITILSPVIFVAAVLSVRFFIQFIKKAFNSESEESDE